MEYPKPAPPKPRPPVGTNNSSGTSKEEAPELPPLYFRHPTDETRVKKVTDPDLAEKLTKQGWTLLDKKPAFVRKEHLTQSLHGNEALQQVRRDLLRENPPKARGPQTKRFIPRKKK